MLSFDYAEAEAGGGWDVHVGLRFDDEPDELYVAHVRMNAEGAVLSAELIFNGMNCRYEWRSGEREALLRYIAEQLPQLAPATEPHQPETD